MRAHKLARDREAEAAAAGTGRAEKRAEQVLARLGRQPGAVIGDDNRDRSILARCGKAQPAGSRLDGVAGEIKEHPVELIAIGADREVGRDRAVDREILLRDGKTGADLVDERGERKAAWRERRSAFA